MSHMLVNGYLVVHFGGLLAQDFPTKKWSLPVGLRLE